MPAMPTYALAHVCAPAFLELFVPDLKQKLSSIDISLPMFPFVLSQSSPKTPLCPFAHAGELNFPAK